MVVELTEQQRNLVHERAGQPVELVDPETHQIYLLIAREQYELERTGADDRSQLSSMSWLERGVAEGIRRSQETLRRDLPKLLEERELRGQWVAYRGEERIGIASSEAILIRECLKRGYTDDEYYIGWIDPCELVEEDELEPRPWRGGREEPAETADNQ
jgi:hypothetical protein